MKPLLRYSAPSMGEVSVTVDQHGRFILTMLHIPRESPVDVRLGFCLDADPPDLSTLVVVRERRRAINHALSSTRLSLHQKLHVNA